MASAALRAWLMANGAGDFEHFERFKSELTMMTPGGSAALEMLAFVCRRLVYAFTAIFAMRDFHHASTQKGAPEYPTPRLVKAADFRHQRLGCLL
jgi:hypothetical protein